MDAGDILSKESLKQAVYEAMQQQQPHSSGLGQALGGPISQLQQLEYQKLLGLQQAQSQWTSAQPTFPTVENVLKRIDAVKEQLKATSTLLKTLEEIHAVLVKHPDLERLVSTMARLGQL